jgi:calcium homeostasis endoplasmic reticulum protein
MLLQQQQNSQPSFSIPEFNQPPPLQQQQQQQPQQANNSQFFNQPPPNFAIPPDFSRPPPGFDNSVIEQQAPIEEINLKPTLPYFDLPAGLMVPLIRLEDHKYLGIDPEDLQLPSPAPPSDRLISAVEAFYAAPSHERPRDTEGWEKLGLYEYFKTKNAVKKQRDEELIRGERARSRSPSPIPEMLTKPAKKIKKRIYRSKSPEKKSRSRSPPSPQSIPAPVINKSRQQKRKSRSPSPVHRGFNRERSRKRSITPPSFAPQIASNNKATEFIDEGNKGHQLLKKLGWQSGGGLGASNQGIAQPISAGEVRDRTELYKVINSI